MYTRVDTEGYSLIWKLSSIGIKLMSHFKHAVLKFIKRTAPPWIANEVLVIPIFGPIFKPLVVLYSLNFKEACDV
jgi:hypothetical protein